MHCSCTNTAKTYVPMTDKPTKFYFVRSTTASLSACQIVELVILLNKFESSQDGHCQAVCLRPITWIRFRQDVLTLNLPGLRGLANRKKLKRILIPMHTFLEIWVPIPILIPWKSQNAIPILILSIRIDKNFDSNPYSSFLEKALNVQRDRW